MDLPFYNRELEINSQIYKYYEGEITDRWSTQLGHLLIVLKTPVRIKRFDENVVRQRTEHPTMNFLVPKRREFLWNKLNTVPLGTKILIQLQKEARSEKLCVSEFHIC